LNDQEALDWLLGDGEWEYCPKCGFQAPNRSALVKHLNREHPGWDIDQEQ
jgi:hypothetical protein